MLFEGFLAYIPHQISILCYFFWSQRTRLATAFGLANIRHAGESSGRPPVRPGWNTISDRWPWGAFKEID